MAINAVKSFAKINKACKGRRFPIIRFSTMQDNIKMQHLPGWKPFCSSLRIELSSIQSLKREFRMRQYVLIITDCRDMPLKLLGFFDSLLVLGIGLITDLFQFDGTIPFLKQYLNNLWRKELLCTGRQDCAHYSQIVPCCLFCYR